MTLGLIGIVHPHSVSSYSRTLAGSIRETFDSIHTTSWCEKTHQRRATLHEYTRIRTDAER